MPDQCGGGSWRSDIRAFSLNDCRGLDTPSGLNVQPDTGSNGPNLAEIARVMRGLHGTEKAVAGEATAETRSFGHLSYQVAILRQSLRRPKWGWRHPAFLTAGCRPCVALFGRARRPGSSYGRGGGGQPGLDPCEHCPIAPGFGVARSADQIACLAPLETMI
jgi:hypothetical protein